MSGAILPKRFYMRHPRIIPISHRHDYLFVRDDGTDVLRTDAADTIALFIQYLMAPRSGEAILSRLAKAPPSVAATLGEMVERGLIVSADEPKSLQASMDVLLVQNDGVRMRPGAPVCEHLVVAMAGGILAGLIAPHLTSMIYSQFQRRLDLIFTKAAQNFVNPALYEYYGVRTWTDVFKLRDPIAVPHIDMGKTCDLYMVMPASASALGRLARGECGDFLSLMAAATKAPILIVPSMNTVMWDQPSVQRNVRQLREDGMYVMDMAMFIASVDMHVKGKPGYGAPGFWWHGSGGLMDAIAAVKTHSASHPRITEF